MSKPLSQVFKFSEITPAETLKDIRKNFDPTSSVDPNSPFYIKRDETKLQELLYNLKTTTGDMHSFLSGHRGSGKTTELLRICLDEDIRKKYSPLFLTAKNFGKEIVHLTHDSLFVEIGLELEKTNKVKNSLCKELEKWGKDIVLTYLKNEKVEAEVGTKAGAWIPYFKAQLSARREWKTEEKQILGPRVQDLIDILNRMAQDLSNKTSKKLLVVVDDLEKGESDAEKEMHNRIFQENYDTLIQPRFSIIYATPVYIRARPGRRISNDELYAFPAASLYPREEKKNDFPVLDTESGGYKMMKGFIDTRLKDPGFIDNQVKDELLRIGGGLFRETARAVMEAAYFAIVRKAARIEMEDVKKVFNQVKKEYQPIIRGEAIGILKSVIKSDRGWVTDIEPFLQTRAVVEYEDNDDVWLDLRYVLKSYVREISSTNA